MAQLNELIAPDPLRRDSETHIDRPEAGRQFMDRSDTQPLSRPVRTVSPQRVAAIATLVAVNGAIAVFIVARVFATRDADVSAIPAPAGLVTPVASLKLQTEDASQADLDTVYASIIARPIFHEDRKYTPPPPEKPPLPTLPPPDYVFSGFMSIPGSVSRGYLLDRSQSRSITVSVGQNVGGWIVERMDGKSIKLVQGTQSAEVTRTGTVATDGASTAAFTPGLPPPPPSATMPQTSVMTAPSGNVGSIATPSPDLRPIRAAPASSLVGQAVPAPTSSPGTDEIMRPPASQRR